MLTLYALNGCKRCVEPALSKGIKLAGKLSTNWRIVPLTTSERLQAFIALKGASDVELPAWYDDDKKEFIHV